MALIWISLFSVHIHYLSQCHDPMNHPTFWVFTLFISRAVITRVGMSLGLPWLVPVRGRSAQVLCAWHLGQDYITQSEVIIWLQLQNPLIVLDQMLLSDSIIWFIWFGILEWSGQLDRYQVSALYWPVWMVSWAKWTPHPDSSVFHIGVVHYKVLQIDLNIWGDLGQAIF